jgi:hypothetical protein
VSLLEWFLANAAMLAGSIVQGGIGFGGNLLAVPVLVLLDPEFIPGPALIGSLSLTLMMIAREPGDGDWPRVFPALVGRVPGTFMGAAVVALLSTDALTWFFAVGILITVAISASGVHVTPTRANLFGGGLASGFMATTIAVGGPPMALVLQSSEGPIVRRTLARFFAVGVGFSFVALATFGEMDLTDVGRGLALIPGTAIGLLLSGRVARYLDRGYTRPAVLILSAIAAVAALVRVTL